MNLYEALTIGDRARRDADQVITIAMLEYLTELDIQGYSQMKLFFLRQRLTEYLPLILAALPKQT